MRKQMGVSLPGFIMWAVGAIFVLLLAFKVGPAYVENVAIKKQFQAIANDPGMVGSSKRDVEGAFVRRATMEDIRSIGPGDLQIVREGDRLVISAEYSTRVPLFGNVNVCLDFSPSSEK
jgi:hypothetical protein